MSEPKDIEVPCLRCEGTGKVTITESAFRRREWVLKTQSGALTQEAKEPKKLA